MVRLRAECPMRGRFHLPDGGTADLLGIGDEFMALAEDAARHLRRGSASPAPEVAAKPRRRKTPKE